MFWERLHSLGENAKSIIEAATGAVLVSLPFWDHVIADLTKCFQLVAAACGAIVGIHGVWGIWKRYRKRSRTGAS